MLETFFRINLQETWSLFDLFRYHDSILFSRPLRVLLLSDIEQISLRRPLMNLQVFLSLWQETCRFS